MKTKIKFRTVRKINESTKENMWDIYKKYYSYNQEYFMQGEKLTGLTGLRINKIKMDGWKKFTPADEYFDWN